MPSKTILTVQLSRHYYGTTHAAIRLHIFFSPDNIIDTRTCDQKWKTESLLVECKKVERHLSVPEDRENGTKSNPVVKALTADLLWLRLISPVDVRPMVIKRGSWHSKDIAVDALNTRLQQQNLDPWVFRESVCKNTPCSACTNYKTNSYTRSSSLGNIC